MTIKNKSVLVIFISVAIYTQFASSRILPENSKKYENRKIEGHIDILILGAGIAGIASARTLVNHNISFLVLEANSKIGGRVRNEYMVNVNSLDSDVLISAGAQWLHGRDNELFRFAEKKGLVVFDGSDEGMGSYVREDFVLIDDDFVTEVDEIANEISNDCMKFVNSSGPYPPTFNDFLSNEFDKRIVTKPEDYQKIALQLLDWRKRYEAIDNGCINYTQVSAKEWGRRWENGGQWEHISLKNGLAEVLDLMVDEIGRDKFLLNKTVESIDWSYLDPVTKENRVLVECSDGTLYTADHTIVTFSLGILKKYAEKMIQPKLPWRHTEAIRCLGYGPISKIFLQWRRNWWYDEEGLQFIYKEPLHKVRMMILLVIVKKQTFLYS